MINSFEFNRWLQRLGAFWAVLCLLGAAPSPPSQEEAFDVVDVIVLGIERTSPRWVANYLDLQLPTRLTQDDVAALSRKLMTTGVFTSVQIAVEPAPAGASVDPTSAREHKVLRILVEEKWTTIPVIRGVYGGGTPLRILGLYDTHSFGRLLTLGGELRKYGDAPPGFVVYARDPRSRGGRYYFGIEFWRDFRRRLLYDREGEVLGAVSTDAAVTRLRMLTPLAYEPSTSVLKDYRWKYGAEIEVVQEAPSIFDVEDDESTDVPADLDFADDRRLQAKVLPTLLYDDVDVSVIEYDGLRLKLRSGPTFAEGETHGSAEAEAFGFEILPFDLNVAMRAFAGQTSFNSLQSQYFLGGLDSIRGTPDGALYGTHAAYLNVELRHITYRMKYLWLQSVAFADAGGAATAWEDVTDYGRATGGIGIRLAVPQVYRMIFRLDYAWSLDGSGTQGITAGMNQFIDPYTPL